jgi:hypothetical protein
MTIPLWFGLVGSTLEEHESTPPTTDDNDNDNDNHTDTVNERRNKAYERLKRDQDAQRSIGHTDDDLGRGGLSLHPNL